MFSAFGRDQTSSATFLEMASSTSATSSSDAASSSAIESSPIKDICVFLMNQTGICVQVRNDSKVNADEILNTLNHQLNAGVRVFREDGPMRTATSLSALGDEIDASSRSKSIARHSDYFALWITSPLLELQLMRKQRPFKILSNWSQLLAKYTSADHKAVDEDDPVLSFQRNVFLPPLEDQTVSDPNILELLYEEAKTNILDGRYPCDDYEQFAAWQAYIDLGPINANQHNAEYFKLYGHLYFPLHYRQRGAGADAAGPQGSKRSPQWFSSSRHGRGSPYNRLVEHYRSIRSDTPRIDVIKKYLKECFAFNFYGAAYFTGQIERATRGVGLLVNHHDKKVWIAINHYGLHVIDQKLSKLVFSLQYNEFKWQVAYPDRKTRDAFECLFVQINLAEGNYNKECRLIQIFSKQASLMANLIKHFTNELPERDVVDSGSFREDQFASTKPVERRAIRKLDKLAVRPLMQKANASGSRARSVLFKNIVNRVQIKN